MQLSVGTADLKDAITWAKDALSQTSPELAKIRLETAGNELKVKAVGREQAACYSVPARIEAEGSAVVWADLAFKGIQSLSSDYCSMETEGNEVKVWSGGFTLKLTEVEDSVEFPDLPPVQGTILPSDLAHGVQRSAFSASRIGNDPEGFKSVRMDFRDSEIIFTATNRYRIARCVAKWSPAKEGKGVALVNASALKSIANSFKSDSDQEPVRIAFNPEDPEIIAFESAGKLKTIQLLDPAALPETEWLFKDDYEINVIMEKEQFFSTFKRVASVADPREGAVHVDISPAKAVISVATEKAHSKETVDATLVGRASEMDFTPYYVTEWLSSITHPFIRLRMNEDVKIVEFDGQDGRNASPDLSYRYLVTPFTPEK